MAIFGEAERHEKKFAQLEAVIKLGRRLASKENVLQNSVGIRRVGGDAAHGGLHCCNHFRQQGTKNMAVAESSEVTELFSCKLATTNSASA